LQVAVCLVEGADQQRGRLDELLVLLLLLLGREAAADVQTLVVGEDDPSDSVEFLHQLLQKFSAFTSHILL
jgi:hypothetical protein